MKARLTIILGLLLVTPPAFAIGDKPPECSPATNLRVRIGDDQFSLPRKYLATLNRTGLPDFEKYDRNPKYICQKADEPALDVNGFDISIHPKRDPLHPDAKCASSRIGMSVHGPAMKPSIKFIEGQQKQCEKPRHGACWGMMKHREYWINYYKRLDCFPLNEITKTEKSIADTLDSYRIPHKGE